jgi:glycosyl transferase, family 25
MRQPIPVFVVNLDRRPDRRAFMASQLDAMGLAWERVSAVDAATAPDAALAPDVALDGHVIRMGRGSQACAATTLALFRRIAASDAPAAVIAQDDTELSPDLAAFVGDVSWIPEGIGIVQFEKWSEHASTKLLGPALGGSPVDGRTIRRLHSRTGGAGCFLVTRDAAARLAAEAPPMRFPIDHLLFNLNLSPLARALGVAIVVPALARQSWDRFASDIVPSTRAQRKSLASRLRRGWYEINLLPAQVAAMAFRGARLRPVAYAERTS